MKHRLLVMNVHFAPHSFGGATVVAEQLSNCLQEEHDWDTLIITTHVDYGSPNYSLRRYLLGNFNVISINISQCGYEENYNNPPVDRIVGEVLQRFQPDLVHCHAIQTLGCGFFSEIKRRHVPLVVTVHDSWWLCERQFMIDGNGRFCFQRKIENQRCQYCVDRPEHTLVRQKYLREKLALADLVLAPSDYQADLYRANGLSAQTCRVNMNGIVPPSASSPRSKREKVCFGFIGGPGAIKGADVIVSAFANLGARDDYKLLVVDAAQNLGSSWNNSNDWKIPGDFEFHPSYTQKTAGDFFAKIDVLLFPSQWRESFGLTVREALARDVWVIATGEGGVAEAIEDGINGSLIPLSPDPCHLQAAIETCIDQAANWQSYKNPLASNIRFFAEQAAELNVMMRQLLDQIA